jgi:urease gamma subunit
MDDIMKFISDYWLIIVIVISLFGSGSWFVTLQGKELRRKFEALGELKGKTKQEIIAAVGSPSAISGAADGKTLCQWMKTGFHIGLIFDGEVCEGISHMADVSEV